jgi:hypothetical protein
VHGDHAQACRSFDREPQRRHLPELEGRLLTALAAVLASTRRAGEADEGLIVALRDLRTFLDSGLVEDLVGDEGKLSCDDVLLVADDTSAFRGPGGKTVDLSRKVALRRVLAALIEVRLSNDPSEVITTHDLFALGWPGEQTHARSGTNRVYVVIAALRTLGLRSILENRGDGYRLDPVIRLQKLPRRALLARR